MERRSRAAGYAERRQMELVQRSRSKQKTVASKRSRPRTLSPPTALGEKLSAVVPAKSAEKLSVVEKNIAVIDTVRVHQQKTEVLFISGNLLDSLDGIQQFSNLRTLSAASNYLASFDSLKALSLLQGLEVLNLQNNPVTQLPYYRLHVLEMCPRLTTLDNKEVSKDKAHMADTLLKEEALLDRMYVQHSLILKMTNVLSKVELHDEFHTILESRGGPKQHPSTVSLELFFISGAELSVWYMPPEDVLPQLRRQVRRLRLIRMASHTADKEVDNAHGWDMAYNEVLEEQSALISSMFSRLQKAICKSYGVSHLEDASSVLAAFKELIGALSAKHTDNELLNEWKHSTPPVTSPTSLPPQQADPGTPFDTMLSEIQHNNERQQLAEQKHKNRLAKTRAHGDMHMHQPPSLPSSRGVSPRSTVSMPTRSRIDDRESSLSPTASILEFVEPEPVIQAEVSQHIADELRLQQVNTALRNKLEEYQRSNTRNANTAKHYKAQLQEAMKRESMLHAKVEDMEIAHVEQIEVLQQTITQLEHSRVQSEESVTMQMEHVRVHEVRLEELERAQHTIAALQRDCDYLRQKVTQYRDEVRMRSVPREEVAQIEECPSEVIRMGNRCLLKRVFKRFTAIVRPMVSQRNACYLLKDVRCIGNIRSVMLQWRRLARQDAFITEGRNWMQHTLRLKYFKMWCTTACRRTLSTKRREIESAWNHWVMKSQQRKRGTTSSGGSSSTPMARLTTPTPTPLPSPSRRAHALRRHKPLRELTSSDEEISHIDPSGRVYSPVEGHTTAVPKRGLVHVVKRSKHKDMNQADKYYEDSESDGEGDYIAPPVNNRKKCARSMLTQQDMFRRWQTYCSTQRRKNKSMAALKCYTRSLKSTTFNSWRGSTRIQAQERLGQLSDHFSAWRKECHDARQRHVQSHMAQSMRKMRESRLVAAMMAQWMQKMRRRALLGRIEESAVEILTRKREKAVFSKWKAAGIRQLLRHKHDKYRLEEEILDQKEKVTTLGLSNMRLVDSLSEAVNKAVSLEVDLEARNTELQELSKDLNTCQASKRALNSKMLGVQHECKERDIRLGVMREELMLGEHKVTQHQAEQLLAEQGAVKTIEELSSELKEKQGGINVLHQQLRGTQKQLDLAHETGATTTDAMLKLTSQLRKTVKDQEEVICSLDVERTQQDKAQEAFQKELLVAQQKIAEGQQERNAYIRQQQDRMHNLKQQVMRSEVALDTQKAETSAHSFQVKKLEHELHLMEDRAIPSPSDDGVTSPMQYSYAHTDTSGEVEELLKRARTAKEQLSKRESDLRKQGAEALIRSSTHGLRTPADQ